MTFSDQKRPADEVPAWRRAHGQYSAAQIAIAHIFSWGIMLLGAAIILSIPVLIWQTRAFLDKAVRVNAPIVDFKIYPPDGHVDHEQYRPIVSLTTPEGTIVRVLVDQARYPNPYQIGQTLPVIYAPGDPQDATDDDPSSNWSTPIEAAVIGPFLLVLGLGLVFWMRFLVRSSSSAIETVGDRLNPLLLLVRLVYRLIR